MAASQPSLVAQALAILAKYGSAANLYLPGVGAINGITAGNWLDSAGTTAATVDGTVGLVVSAGKAVGPELVAPLNFLNTGFWSSGGNVGTVTTNSLTTTAPGGLFALIPGWTASKFYEIRCAGTSSVSWLLRNTSTGAGAISVPAGAFNLNTLAPYLQLSSNGSLFVQLSAAGTISFSSLSARELPGAHLTQSTAANQPILRRGLVNQLTQSDFQNGVTDAPTRGGLVTASTLAGYGGAIAFGHDGSAVSYGYKFFAATLNAAYTLAFVVKMDDGNAPVFGNVICQDASNPFAVVMYGDAYSPIGAGGYTVTALADNTYLVTCSAVATTAVSSNFGVVKYPANNNRTFKVTRYGLFTGTVTASQILAAGGIPLTTTAPANSTNGPFAWQFDGSNDSFTSTLVTGGSGWICSGVRLSADVLATVANAGEGNAMTKGFWLANVPSYGLMLATSNGSVRTQSFAPRPTLNTPVVVEAGWDSSSQFVSSHGFGTESSVRSGDCSSGGETLRIGNYRLDGSPFHGTIGATIIMHTVLPTASERATLRQFVASLSGVTM